MDELVNVAQKIHEAAKASKHAAALASCSLTSEDDDPENTNAIYRRRAPTREQRAWMNLEQRVWVNLAWCYLHRRFGPSTRNCRAPCSFTENKKGGHK